MKIHYDQEVDILDIILNNAEIVDSEENDNGIILDYDKDKNIVSVEILNASKKTNLNEMLISFPQVSKAVIENK